MELLIVIIFLLWLLGYFGPNYYRGIPRTGNIVHVLLIVALVLLILRLI